MSKLEEDLDPRYKTGVGNPLSPYNDVLLSAEDEKRMDDKGNLVVEGLPWSQVPTNRYLWVALWWGSELTQLVPGGKGQTDTRLGWWSGRYNLSMGISVGPPRFNKATIGACIEVPADLADDPLKKQYMVEWLVATVQEALEARKLGVPADKQGDLGVVVATMAERAIGSVL